MPLPFVGGEQAGSESVVAALRVAEKNRRVSAVLFYVDSPGGDALASDLIWREVERISAKKPVVVLMGNAAASGGYYVSAAGEPRRRAPRHGYGLHRRTDHPPRRARPLREAGYQPRRAGQGGACRPSRPQPPARRRRAAGDRRPDRTHLRRVQGPCRQGAQDGRSPTSKASPAEGYGPGTEALDLGLVDETGGFREALRKARELGGIERDVPEVLVKGQPAPRRASSSGRARAGPHCRRDRGDVAGPLRASAPAAFWRSRRTRSRED